MNEDFDYTQFIQNLWERENSLGLRKIAGSKSGYDAQTGRYKAYTTPNGNEDVGPGFDLEHQSEDFVRKARTVGFTKDELDKMVMQRLKDEGQYFRKRIQKEGGNPGNLTNEVYGGLLDMYWQLRNGLYTKYPNFWKAVANGDYEGMQRESLTKYKDSKGEWHDDTGRWEFRKNTYFKEPQTPKPLYQFNYNSIPHWEPPMHYPIKVPYRREGGKFYKSKFKWYDA